MKTIRNKLLQVLTPVLIMIFSFNAFSQDVKKAEEGTMHIKISVEKDGKTTNIDTVINEKDIEALNEKLREMDINISETPGEPGWEGENSFKFDFDTKEFAERMKELAEKMKDMKWDGKELEKQIEATKKEMKQGIKMYKYDMKGDSLFDIKIDGLADWANEDGNMNFNFNCDGKRGMVIIDDDTKDGDTAKTKRVIVRNFSSPDGKEIDMDTLEGAKVIVINKTTGKDGTKSDVEVKVIKGKKEKGEKKKDKTAAKKISSASSGNEAAWLKTFEYFPNPTDGKLTVRVSTVGTEPVEISVKDISGREVYSERIESANGLIEREINLSAKAKGAYLLAVRQGTNWKHEKIILK